MATTPLGVTTAALIYRFWWVVAVVCIALSAWLTQSIAVDIAHFKLTFYFPL